MKKIAFFAPTNGRGFELKIGEHFTLNTADGRAFDLAIYKDGKYWLAAELSTGMRCTHYNGYTSRTKLIEHIKDNSVAGLAETMAFAFKQRATALADAQAKKQQYTVEHIDKLNTALAEIEAQEAERKATAKAMLNSGYGIAAVKRVIKSTFNAPKAHYNGVYEYNGFFWMVDGYRLFRLRNDIPSVEHVNAVDRYEDGYSSTEKLIDGVVKDCTIELAMPNIAEIKAFIKENKDGRKCSKPYFLADSIYVNPQYLIDAIEILKPTKIYYTGDMNRPVYFVGEHGDGILLPIRPSWKDHTKEAAERKARYENEEQGRKEWEAAEKQANEAATASAIADAEAKIVNGELVKNEDVIIYTANGEKRTERLIIVLANKYGISIPGRTKGYLRDKIVDFSMDLESAINVRYLKKCNGYDAGLSDNVYKYIRNICEAIKATRAMVQEAEQFETANIVVEADMNSTKFCAMENVDNKRIKSARTNNIARRTDTYSTAKKDVVDICRAFDGSNFVWPTNIVLYPQNVHIRGSPADKHT